jgi:signal peptidase I
MLAAELDRRGVLPRGKLLIKRVVAAAGDAVCRRDGTVLVNDEVIAQAKSNDSTGEPLPSWQGCASLHEGQVFLLGDTAGSYDGRYFGVTRASEIIGRAELLLTF